MFPTEEAAQRRVFFSVLAISTLIKLWLAAAIPFTGDEAYFWLWGQHPDWGGFYDHPPMAGWWLWALHQVSSSILVLRLPAILLWIVIAFGMMDLLRRLQPHDTGKAWLMGSLFLALPFTWSLNLITTDTPLILFLFLSGYAFLRGEQSGQLRWHAAAGVMLGLALLSKYFAGLLAIAYAVYFLPRGRHAWLRLLIIALCALPFMLMNLAWNASHCWNNILFNLYNRNAGSQFDPKHLVIYLLMMLYLVTPWTGWRLVKHGAVRGFWPLVSVFAVPFVLFLLLSFYKTIGLHWVLAFLPFVFLWAGVSLDVASLRSDRRWTLWLGLPHLVALLLLAYLPSSALQGMKLHTDIVVHREGKALVSLLREDLPADGTIMTQSYSLASLLSYHGGTYMPVFGAGSFHARFDDNITNFRDHAGKSIRIVSTRRMDPATLSAYFDSVAVREREIDGARFWIADGQGFRFETYHAQVLTHIAATYYRMPAFLPLTGCRFLEQYGFERQNR